jgi:hypothetical protein
MSDADKQEIKTLLSESFAEGLALFRSKAEEEAAKAQQNKQENSGDDNDTGDNGKSKPGFSFSGFLLGE